MSGQVFQSYRGGLCDDRIGIEVSAVKSFAPKRGWNAFVVTNPTYGERVGEVSNLKRAYRSFGESLRSHCGGYTVAVLSNYDNAANTVASKIEGLIRRSR